MLALVLWTGLVVGHAQGNQAPVFVSLSPSRVSENIEQGSYVTTLSVFDFDQSDSHTFELATRGDYLYVQGNSLYANSRLLNYERDETLYVNIVVTDDGSPPKSKSFQVGLGLRDANDPPATILVSNRIIDAAVHSIGDVVANLTVCQAAPCLDSSDHRIFLARFLTPTA